MYFDSETQKVSCLVGKPTECTFVVESKVSSYQLNKNRSRLLVSILPTSNKSAGDQLALLDLQTSEFRVFHETDAFSGLYDLVISPDGMWAAYQQQHLVDCEDGRREEVINIRIVSTCGVGTPAYELECNECRIPDLQWSHDSQHLAFGGFQDLWVVTNNEGIWEGNKYFTEEIYKTHITDSWSPQYDLLLTSEWIADKPEPDLGYYYLLDPIQNSYVELFQRRQGPSVATEGWLDSDTLFRIDPVVSEKYTQESILFLTDITPDSIPIELSTQQYILSFEHKGFPFEPTKLSETQITFGRITAMPDFSYSVETYTFDTSNQELTRGASCLFDSEQDPFTWKAVWSPDNDLLFSEFRGRAFILSGNGLGCIDLNLLLGGDFENLNWAP